MQMWTMIRQYAENKSCNSLYSFYQIIPLNNIEIVYIP